MAVLAMMMVVPFVQAEYADRYGGYAPRYENRYDDYRYRAQYPQYPQRQQYPQYRQRQPEPAAPRYQQPVRTTVEQSPDQLLKQGIEKTFDYLKKSGSIDLSNVLDFVEEELSPYFDFSHTARLAVGAHAKELDEEQMAQLTKKIKGMFISALGQQLASYAYTHHRVTFYSAKRSSFGKEVSVMAKITHPRGFPVRVTFRFYPTEQGWKIYDVSANNNSAVMYYRSQIALIAQRYGLEKLLEDKQDEAKP